MKSFIGSLLLVLAAASVSQAQCMRNFSNNGLRSDKTAFVPGKVNTQSSSSTAPVAGKK